MERPFKYIILYISHTSMVGPLAVTAMNIIDNCVHVYTHLRVRVSRTMRNLFRYTDVRSNNIHNNSIVWAIRLAHATYNNDNNNNNNNNNNMTRARTKYRQRDVGIL
jgi:hypothetical protein